MSEAIFSKDNITKIDSRMIQYLKQKAFASPYKIARFCLHKTTQEILHEMIIVICKDVYVRPHKHIRKTESFHVIEGSFFLILFDEDGKIIEKILMDTGKKDNNFLCRLEKNYWHTVIPISDFVVFHETTQGPYTGTDDSIFALWAPERDDHSGIKKFIDQMLNSR